MVSVPQQTTALFCGCLSYIGAVIFSPIDSICVTEPECKRDFKVFISPPVVVAVVTVVRRLYAGKRHERAKQERKVWRKEEKRGPLGNAFKTDQTRLKGDLA